MPFIPDVPGMRALVASHFCDFLISSHRDVMAELRAVVGPGGTCRTIREIVAPACPGAIKPI